MSFSTAQYEEVTTRYRNAVDNDLPNAVNTAIHYLEDAFGWIPFVGDLIKDALNKIRSLADDVLRQLAKLWDGVNVPTAMWHARGVWLDVQKDTASMAKSIGTQVDASASQWRGLAGGAYAMGVSEQAPAAAHMSSVAATVAGACSQISDWGMMFYEALIVTVTACEMTLLACPTPVGVILALEEVPLGVGTAMTIFQHGVLSQAGVLKGAMASNYALPDGAWPVATRK